MLTRRPQICHLTHTAQRLYRAPVQAVSDDRLAGQLRTNADCLTSHQRGLAESAISDIEDDLHIALVPHVREMKFTRFPLNNDGPKSRLNLDWRSVWSSDDWTAFTALKDAESGAPTWITPAWTELDSVLFDSGGDTPPPLTVSWTDCDGDVTVLDPATYTLTNSERGDYLCPADGCNWPCLPCRRNGCEQVAVRFICGYLTPEALELDSRGARLVHSVLALFGHIHESPETMHTAARTNYDDVLRPMRRGQKWRP